MTGILIFVVFIALMIAGVPIGISLMLGGAVGIGLGQLGWLAIPNNFYSGIAKYPLLALPMFVLVGAIFDRSGVAKRLVDFAIAIVGRGPGMLPLVAISVAIGKLSTRKLGNRKPSTCIATRGGRPASATLRTSSNTTPTDSDTTVKAAMPNSSGPINSDVSHRSISGRRCQSR